MNEPHVEWEREYLTKYSNINRMKNGLRKSYFYETNCRHQKNSLEEVECPLCSSLFDCCDKCYMDFTQSDVIPETYDDLVCPDCLEQCKECKKYITDDNGSRADVYPYDLYCHQCASNFGYTYDEPGELDDNKKNQEETDNDADYTDNEDSDDDEEYSDEDEDYTDEEEGNYYEAELQ